MKPKTLITILGITALSLIPKSINETYIKKINPPLQFKETKYKSPKLSNEELNNYKKQIDEIKDEITLLDAKKDFFLRRLNEIDTSSKRKEFYLKELKEAKINLKKYYSKRDSLYNLIRD